MKNIPALLIALFLMTTPVLAQTSAPYDFKGVQLGISIDDFRKMPHPDADNNDAHYVAKDSSVMCTGEKVALTPDYSAEPTEVMIYDSAEKAAGVVKCVWVNQTEDRMARGKTAGLSLADSGYAIYDYSFRFIPDPKDGVLRLYRFIGETNRNAFGSVQAALTNKFGKPAVSQDEVQNGIGNIFTRTILLWKNDVSEILVSDRFSELNKMTIVVSDKRLVEAYKRAISAAKPISKNPI